MLKVRLIVPVISQGRKLWLAMSRMVWSMDESLDFLVRAAPVYPVV